MNKPITNQQDNCVTANFQKLKKLAVDITKEINEEKNSLKNLLNTTKIQ